MRVKLLHKLRQRILKLEFGLRDEYGFSSVKVHYVDFQTKRPDWEFCTTRSDLHILIRSILGTRFWLDCLEPMINKSAKARCKKRIAANKTKYIFHHE